MGYEPVGVGVGLPANGPIMIRGLEGRDLDEITRGLPQGGKSFEYRPVVPLCLKDRGLPCGCPECAKAKGPEGKERK